MSEYPGQESGAENEDVELDWEYSTEENFEYSMGDLTSVGYEPPTDDDSSPSSDYVA